MTASLSEYPDFTKGSMRDGARHIRGLSDVMDMTINGADVLRQKDPRIVPVMSKDMPPPHDDDVMIRWSADALCRAVRFMSERYSRLVSGYAWNSFFPWQACLLPCWKLWGSR